MFVQKTIQAISIFSWLCVCLILSASQMAGATLLVPMSFRGQLSYTLLIFGSVLTIVSAFAYGVIHKKVFISKKKIAKICSIILLTYDMFFFSWMIGGGVVSWCIDKFFSNRISGLLGAGYALVYGITLILLYQHSDKRRI